MKHITYMIFLVALVSSCAMLMPTKPYEKALAKASAQRWSAGARGGDRGVTFRVRFYKLEEDLQADTLVVNDTPLTTEITTVGDTTYVTSFFYTNKTEERTLANAAEYTGKLRVIVAEKPHYISIDRFVMQAQELRP